MGLSFSEKRTLQKIVDSKQAELEAGNLPFKDKRAAQKALDDALAQLDAAVEMFPDAQNQKLADLIAGKYNNEPPEAFLKVIKEIIEEIKSVEPVKSPTIAYVDANKDKINAIMESAFAEVFGKMWDGGMRRFQRGFGADQQMIPQQSYDAVRTKPQEEDDGPPRKISIDIDDDFYGPAVFRSVIQAIDDARAQDAIVMKINSNGGDTQSAQAIYVALLKTPARTKAVVINAYSAGSIVAMACDEIEPTPFCTMMVHNASLCSGNGQRLRDLASKAAFLNDYFGEWFHELYAGFLTEEELADVAKGQELWLKEPQIRERLKTWEPIRQRVRGGVVQAA